MVLREGLLKIMLKQVAEVQRGEIFLLVSDFVASRCLKEYCPRVLFFT